MQIFAEEESMKTDLAVERIIVIAVVVESMPW
jgi:hypothetical protein